MTADLDARTLLADAGQAIGLALDRLAARDFDMALDLVSSAARRIDEARPILRTLAGLDLRR
jgi:hypothetical protein